MEMEFETFLHGSTVFLSSYIGSGIQTLLHLLLFTDHKMLYKSFTTLSTLKVFKQIESGKGFY